MTVQQPRRRLGSRAFCVLVSLIVLLFLVIATDTQPPSRVSASPGQMEAQAPHRNAKSLAGMYGAVNFEVNRGQTDPTVKYLARGCGYTLFLTDREAVFALAGPRDTAGRRAPRAETLPARSHFLKRTRQGGGSALRLQLAAANPRPEITAGGVSESVSNYYLGSNPRNWHTGVPHYGSVEYARVYPGVDLVFHGEQQQLEFDFHVAAGADPSQVALQFSGAEKLAVDGAGDLIVSSRAGDLRLHKPVASQESPSGRQTVTARFSLGADDQVRFALGSYDRSRELVIDPAVAYSTFLGGSGEDEALAIAVDAAGDAYVTGTTESPNFPGSTGAASGFDIFVSKLNPDGSGLLYTTLIGGSDDDIGNSIAVDNDGNAYVAGDTASSDFPHSSVVLQTALKGALDGFVAKLNTGGAVFYTTYLGGSDGDGISSIAVDSKGNVYVAGETLSTDFPGTASSTIQPSNPDAHAGFVAKLNSIATEVTFATYLGGSNVDLATGVAVNSAGNVYVTGITLSENFPVTGGVVQAKCGSDGTCNGAFDDGFVTAIKPDGSGRIYSTYLGGSGTDDALSITADADGNAYVTGGTDSTDFPTANAFQEQSGGDRDAFVTKLNASGTQLLFSTYLGGESTDTATHITLDEFEDVFVTGRTFSSSFPTGSASQSTKAAGSDTADAFVSEIGKGGSLIYSSYLGGSGNEDSFGGDGFLNAVGGVAVDPAGNVYLAGNTSSDTDFPTTAPMQSAYGGGLADAFVAKLAASPSDFSVTASSNSASIPAGQVANYNIKVSSVNSPFGGSVTLTCSGLPMFAGCGFNPTAVIPGATAATSMLSVSTGLAAARSTPSVPAPLFYAIALPFAGVFVSGMGRWKRPDNHRQRMTFPLAGVMILALALLTSCGAGSSGASGVKVPPGSYDFSVTGAGGATSHAITLTLIVQ